MNQINASSVKNYEIQEITNRCHKYYNDCMDYTISDYCY